MKEESFNTPLLLNMEHIFIVVERIVGGEYIFISAGARWGEEPTLKFLAGYMGHLCGTMEGPGISSNTVMIFHFSRLDNVFYSSFGGKTDLSEARSTAAQVRCVRDE